MEALRRLCVRSSLLVVLVCPQAWGQLTIPNTFTPGTPAVAAEMNENFQAVATAVNSGAGVEFVNNVGNMAITNIDTLVASIDVAAPVAGYLIVNASGSAVCSNATSLTIRLHNATTAVSSPSTFENRPVAIQGLTMYYSTHYVFDVSAGSNVIQLTGSCIIGTGAMNANSLSALFVPTRYSP
jgi:hypothetical protein